MTAVTVPHGRPDIRAIPSLPTDPVEALAAVLVWLAENP
jgi:hypothetical protein